MNDLSATIAFAKYALLHNYRAMLPHDCAISHHNFANYLESVGQPDVAQAHRLADTILCLQIQDGTLQDSLNNLSQFDLSYAPPAFEQIADMVEQVPGVRFREMWKRLPQRYADGDAALAAVWEMARELQRQRSTFTFSRKRKK